MVHPRLDSSLRKARLKALLKLFPAIQLFSLVDVVLLAVYFWSDVDSRFLLGWGLAAVVQLAFWLAYSRRPDPSYAALVAHAVLEALLFAVFLVVVFPQISAEKAVVLGAFVTGLLAAGGLSKMTVPPAALGFTVTLGVGGLAALALSVVPNVWVPQLLLLAFGAAISILGLGMSQMFDARFEAERELELTRLLRFDSLTGLLNRTPFRRHLDDLFAAGPPPSPRALVLINVANFKDVNEARGHAFGDALLRAVADRIREIHTEGLVMARLDGDEFALEAPTRGQGTVTPQELDALSKRLAAPYALGADRIEVGFRLGIAEAPKDAQSPEQWLRCADLALRTARERGANTAVAFTPDLMDSYRRRNLLKEALREALARQEFALAFQPIVDLATGQATGCEALLRWTHPQLGAISPAVFIPLAEEGDDILALGRWVLESACRTAADWPESISVSVNVSGVQLHNAAFFSEVTAILENTAFDPHRLILEVTETALIRDEGVVQKLNALKAIGIRLALDDFGTGYSSLSYLHTFPFDKLKIDQSFVRGAPADQPPALVGSIVTLATALGLKTTAEGIETRAQLEQLRALGCQQGQGYFFSRPVPADHVAKLLGQNLAEPGGGIT